MADRNTTLAEYIEDVAVRTGARADFIEKIGFIFSSRGISLSEPAEAYASIVEETFLLDETRRMSDEGSFDLLDLFSLDKDLARGYLHQQVERLLGPQETMEQLFRRGASDAPACETIVSAARTGNVYIFPGSRQSH